MRALGFATLRYRLTAFAIAGTMCGVAGVLLANLTNFASPAYMHWTRSGELMVMVILGGMGNVTGAIVGSVLLVGLPEVFRVAAEYRVLIYGVTLLLLIRFRPQGLLGTV